MIKNKGTLIFLFPSAFMLLLVACGGAAAPLVDIEATIEARVKERLAAIPTPTARVVEKIMKVVATPTPIISTGEGATAETYGVKVTLHSVEPYVDTVRDYQKFPPAGHQFYLADFTLENVDYENTYPPFSKANPNRIFSYDGSVTYIQTDAGYLYGFTPVSVSNPTVMIVRGSPIRIREGFAIPIGEIPRIFILNIDKNKIGPIELFIEESGQ